MPKEKETDPAVKAIFFRTGCFLLGLIGLVFWVSPVQAAESLSIERLIEALDPVAGEGYGTMEREERLRQGKRLYRKWCVSCHGVVGKGDGKASSYLLPVPRDLSMGIFKFRSTQTNNLPLDRDLEATIRRGLPGTPMAAWGEVLSDNEIRLVVEYIKSFSSRFELERPDFQYPPELEPPFTTLSVEKGKTVYHELRCGRCHGEDGRKYGFLEGELKDTWGNRSLVYDLTHPGFYKGGASGEEIYQTLLTGMDGTAMNAYDYLSPDERWHLVHYLQSHLEQTEPVEPPARFATTLISVAVADEIEYRSDALWDHAPAVTVQLLPVRAHNESGRSARLQSVHNDQAIAFRIRWKDPTPDGARIRGDGFLDAVAVQFAHSSTEGGRVPFFGMGERGKPVNIWHWKADVSQVIEGRSDSSGLLEETGFLDPFREAPVEEIIAEGFGSLSVQALEDQHVSGRGMWREGWWEVVLVRDLDTPGPRDIRFNKSRPVKVALALWDGFRKDRNENKMVSLWQELVWGK